MLFTVFKERGLKLRTHYTTHRKSVVATAAILGADTRRTYVQVVHIVATVPSRRPEVADAALIARRAIAEAAGKRRRKGFLEGFSVVVFII